MPHSRRRGRWFPRAPPAPSSRQCANAALTGSGNISLPHIPGTPCRGSISTPCVLEGQVVAIFRRNASPGCRPWQDFAAMRSRAAIRGGFFASCVPEGASDGKSAPSWQHIAAVHPKRAGFGKICAPCIRKAPQTGVRGCTARISCREDALFAARAPQIMHGARILPSFGSRRAPGFMRRRPRGRVA